ncbi:hypothetical protein HYDPIDRAFT_118859, partial [Hydnomerulius pinastri MD-312]
MAPRKRTKHGKESSTPSPDTSTSTTSEPQPSPSKAPPTDASTEIPNTRPKKVMAPVSPPGSKTPFNRFIYALALGAALLLGWYVYGMVTLLGKLKDEVGWWGLIVGGTGGRLRGGSSSGAQTGWGSWMGSGSGRTSQGTGEAGELESRLNVLADALGIPAKDVASAIKPFVPPASLKRLAPKMKETGVSEAVRVLLEENSAHGGDNSKGGSTGVAGGIAEGIGQMVGF